MPSVASEPHRVHSNHHAQNASRNAAANDSREPSTPFADMLDSANAALEAQNAAPQPSRIGRTERPDSIAQAARSGRTSDTSDNAKDGKAAAASDADAADDATAAAADTLVTAEAKAGKEPRNDKAAETACDLSVSDEEHASPAKADDDDALDGLVVNPDVTNPKPSLSETIVAAAIELLTNAADAAKTSLDGSDAPPAAAKAIGAVAAAAASALEALSRAAKPDAGETPGQTGPLPGDDTTATAAQPSQATPQLQAHAGPAASGPDALVTDAEADAAAVADATAMAGAKTIGQAAGEKADPARPTLKAGHSKASATGLVRMSTHAAPSTASQADAGAEAQPAPDTDAANGAQPNAQASETVPAARYAPHLQAKFEIETTADDGGTTATPATDTATDALVTPASASPATAAASGPNMPASAAAGVSGPSQGPAAALPLAALPVEIATQARAGKNHFEIRLDPPELGRIHVKLDVDGDGNVSSRLVVDRAETLDLLKRDASQLERALQQAGLKTSDNALQFSLRQEGFARDDSPSRNGGPMLISDDEPAPLEALRQGYGRLLGLGGGLDIRV